MAIVQLVQLLLVVRTQRVDNVTAEEYSYAAALGAVRDVMDVTTLGGLDTGGIKWHGIEFAPTAGMLYSAPFNAASVLIINPTTNITDTSTLGGSNTLTTRQNLVD